MSAFPLARRAVAARRGRSPARSRPPVLWPGATRYEACVARAPSRGPRPGSVSVRFERRGSANPQQRRVINSTLENRAMPTVSGILLLLASLTGPLGAQNPAATDGARVPARPAEPSVAANDNRTPAGTLRRGGLALTLVAQRARWHPEADDGPALDIEALGEEGKPPTIPGPLVRVRAGTRIETTIRNALPDTLLVFGLSGSGSRDTVRIAPGASGRARLTAGTPGTYGYGGATIVGDSLHQLGTGNQLLGALIVDDANPRPDR